MHLEGHTEAIQRQAEEALEYFFFNEELNKTLFVTGTVPRTQYMGSSHTH